LQGDGGADGVNPDEAEVEGKDAERMDEQVLVSLKLNKSVDAEGGRTLAVIIEGG